MVLKSWKLRFGVCYEKVKRISILMEVPSISAFVEKQLEIKSSAWSGKTAEGLGGPSDCHKTAKMMSDEGAL
jgi:hypothetical protein